MIRIAIAGNPNTGKTSLFNELTSSYEYVGNWTGVTVEKKVGQLRGGQAQLIDLPGVYSLYPVSRDEGVATQFLLSEPFDSLVNVVDASQLERNLHLTVQLLEYGKPLVMALNMVDVARQRGIAVHAETLAEQLRVPVVPIVARTGKGTKELTDTMLAHSAEETRAEPLRLDYGPELESAIAQLEDWLPAGTMPPRWLAIQYLEGNPLVREAVENEIDRERLDRLVAQTEAALREAGSAKPLSSHLRLKRADYIGRLLSSCVEKKSDSRIPFSEKLDRLVTHPVLGIPVFLLVMYLMFKLTFDWVGSPFSDLLDAFLNGPVRTGLETAMRAVGVSAVLQAVVLEGIVAGVGGVLVFVPQIFMLFLLISFIEDSGYMARIAAVMDRLMEKMGLNGKAFIPMIIGFGCNVPGVMAARTIEQPKERLLTILLTPLMSCSARLSVYSLFVGAFFTSHRAVIVLSLYVLGIVIALALAKLFSSTLLKQEGSVFVVELPPYRVPQWRTLARSTWEKGKGFVRKAGTFIFGGSVFIWLLGYTGPGGWNVKMDDSFLAMAGGLLAPLLAPLGFGNWQAGAALLTGFLAKEVVVATMNIIYAAPDTDTLQGILANFFTPLQAYSFMAFILLYVPCLATVGVIRKETGSARWTWFSIVYALVVAYLVSLVIMLVGRSLGYR
ncbi:ferrous iron transport protein B [Paenibacillus sp. J31TS4]|uniref:ferrous iron transport protein B n=1 Tax=Paenibacillus sp. J31TS4 TaxID=2807195 RepID=UPI001B23F94E|nr:ferrous iron transport protein B [Paenibacillus sp. J31TS4]GIP38906.1 ferrous iron transport protein B [Paenibacillus sp. J31TS4]